MRVFVSYRFTGVDKVAIDRLLAVACDALKTKGVEPVCVHFEVAGAAEGQLSPEEAMRESFRLVDKAGALFVLQDAPARSEGMLMEVGYCIAKGWPVIVATQQAVTGTYLPAMADVAVRWGDYDDLARVIGQIDFNGIERRAVRV